ncbi:alpha/beta hydrolase [Corynebacterium sp. HS2168-gen11]|uniref:alpha/beta hydrolase n=1 Tax=Corynebacterium sp. HS2168-gen11 TaxID=2974027 RepID=UPI00216ABBDD|nr:alpha/beta hydrolase [Corynebacterium sp. HS2168-gen11]MCS4536310.1 alpha/beta hydrolase [Corynebacterium sp. HS2168-gen11]
MTALPADKHFWQPDILGADYQCHEFDLGTDPDGESPIVATLIRHQPSAEDASKPAILYIHGMTDYFFQSHMAQYFASHGYAFYAVDLRKCGRSRREAQTWHYISDIRLYRKELSIIATHLHNAHPGVIVLGHSTGGLIAVDWVHSLRTNDPKLYHSIQAIVLNSPWFDLMGPKYLVPLIKILTQIVGKFQPLRKINGGPLGVYGRTMHISLNGEWEYNTEFKPISGHNKYFGWLRAILIAQRRLHKGAFTTDLPVLTLCSDASRLAKPYSQQSHITDTVLDVDQIIRWSAKTSTDVTTIRIPQATHDVFLSQPHVRKHALALTIQWLQAKLAQPES